MENKIKELEEKLLLKEQECEAYKMEAEEGKEINAELKADNEKLKNATMTLAEGLNFRQVKIEKIKEIAEKEVNNRMLFADKESFYDFNKILQICDEVNDGK